jgi:hypothetical protein
MLYRLGEIRTHNANPLYLETKIYYLKFNTVKQTSELLIRWNSVQIKLEIKSQCRKSLSSLVLIYTDDGRCNLVLIYKDDGRCSLVLINKDDGRCILGF